MKKNLLFLGMVILLVSASYSEDRMIEKSFGTFSIPETFAENKVFSTEDKPFFVLKDDDSKLDKDVSVFVSNVSVEKRRNRYSKDDHISFRQAIVQQLTYQCGVSGFNLDADGYHTKKGYVVYKFILSPNEDLIKTYPDATTTIQYYIIAENNAFILVHETTKGRDKVTDNAAEMIVDTFSL